MGWFGADNRGRVLRAPSLDLRVGMVMPTVLLESDVPDGWLPCDGRGADPVLYPQLHAFLVAAGSPYGTTGGNPRIPDAAGRFPVGVGSHASVAVLGANEGLANGSRTPQHTHQVPGHQHTVVSHSHGYAAHQHTTPAHTHQCELHDHDLASHGHTISGNTGPAIDGAVDVAFTTDPTPADRISFTAHAHGNGSYGGDQRDVGATNQAGNGVSSTQNNQANGGWSGLSAAGSVGPNTDVVNANPTVASGGGSTPYLACRFIIKAEA